MKRRAWLFLLPAMSIGIGFSCFSQHAFREPLKVLGAPPPAARVPLDVTPQAPKGEVDLSKYAPLLARPEFKTVQDDLAEGRYEAAIEALKKLQQEHDENASKSGEVEDAWRIQFLLARTLEKTEKFGEARRHFERVARSESPLRDYARVSLARVLLELDDPSGAMAELEPLPPAEPLSNQRLRLAASIHQELGQYELSFSALRELLTQGSEEPELRLQLASVVSDWSESGARVAEKSSEAPSAGVASVAEKSRALSTPEEAAVLEALRGLKRVRLSWPDDVSLSSRASLLEARLLAARGKSAGGLDESMSLEEQAFSVGALLERRLFEEASNLATSVLSALDPRQRHQKQGCEIQLLRAKAEVSRRDYSKASDLLTDPVSFCRHDPDLRARTLFLAGRYAAIAGRHALAIKSYEQLEAEVPQHRLADDARLGRAQSYRRLGSEARFVELLSTITDDYPAGDMALDGAFALALSRIEQNDWGGAATTLERIVERARREDRARRRDSAGRERYFLARSWVKTGEVERGLSEYESIIVEVPLSYYMLHAYTQLHAVSPERARAALARAEKATRERPFVLEERAEYREPGFVRAMELLGLGEVVWAKAELERLGLFGKEASPGALWAVALLYFKAGALELAHKVARGLLTDWLEHWPAGDWTLAWKIAYPTPYEAIVEREIKGTAVTKYWLYAIMREESAFDPQAVSIANAYGLMQLIVPTAKMVGQPLGVPYSARALLKPSVNIKLGSTLLHKLLGEFADDPVLIIPSYNAGPGRARQWRRQFSNVDFDVWVELIPFSETRGYTRRVLASRATYAFLYHPEDRERTILLPLRLSQK